MITLEHVAIWTRDLESLKAYYERFFRAAAGPIYNNPETGFSSYFLTFGNGARLELMHRDTIPENANDTVKAQHLGLIHLAFALTSKAEVDAKAEELLAAGHVILRGPRMTGDGYYEFETLDPDQNRLEVIFKG